VLSVVVVFVIASEIVVNRVAFTSEHNLFHF
jgi:hypothetical protein